MKRSSVAHLNCSMAQTLDVVGEWWSLLVLRNVFFGQRRFEAIQSDLGIARNILSDRLSTLVDHGVLEKVKYQDTPERFEYQLTEKGLDLFPVLMALMNWGDKWMSPDGPPLVLIHRDCQQPMTPLTTCSNCGGEVHHSNVKVSAGPGMRRPRPHATQPALSPNEDELISSRAEPSSNVGRCG